MQRKLFTSLVLVSMLVMSVQAATMIITQKDGTQRTYQLENVKNLAFGSNTPVLSSVKRALKENFSIISKTNRKFLRITGNAQTPYNVSIYDLSGKKMFTKNAIISAGGEHMLELPVFSVKIYLVRFSLKGSSISKLVNFMN